MTEVSDKQWARARAIVGEAIAVVSLSYSADRSEFDSGLLAIREFLQLIADNPAQSYFGHITCRHSESRRLREARNSVIDVLAAMLERQSAYATNDVYPPIAARAAIGGGEALIRRELSAGRAARLPELLPDLAYTYTVAYMGQETALEMAQRARDLLAGRAWNLP